MREEDLSDELKKLHKSARFMTFWEPSTTVKYNTAYKVIAHKIISIISKEVYDNGNFIGYNGEVGKIIQHRPIYTLISKTVNHPSTYGSNILILRRRQFYNSWVIAPQMPFGGLT